MILPAEFFDSLLSNCISYSSTPNTGCPVLGVHGATPLKPYITYIGGFLYCPHKLEQFILQAQRFLSSLYLVAQLPVASAVR